jgi:DNA-binding SARP family transcriptional activator/tetratricopeptide (TPR) repeat protein
VDFRLLGPVEVWAGDRPVEAGQPRQRAVLAALLVDAGQVVAWDTLVDRVWGQRPPRDAHGAVRANIARIRQVLARTDTTGEERIGLTFRGGGYLLDADRDRIDLHRFRRLVNRAGAAERTDDQRVALLREAVALWRGQPLSGIGGEWASRVRESWRREHLEATVAWARAELRVGHPGAVLGPVSELSGEYPLIESVAAVLMRTLWALGQPADALDQYRRIRQRLVEELGTEPGEELRGVQQAILRGTSGTSGTAGAALPRDGDRPAGAAPAQLPVAPAGFVGREELIARLDALLTPGDGRPAGVALVGQGGVGKTALALVAAHRVARRYPDGQLFLDLYGDHRGHATPPEHVLDQLLRSLGVPPDGVPAGLAERAALYRSLLHDRKVLVVLDNAADSGQLAPLLPAGPTCALVVTSRNQLTVLTTEQAVHALPVDVLTRQEAIDLLAEVLGADRVRGDQDAAVRLVERCGRLPLALRIAAARLRIRPHRPLRDLAEDLADEGSRLSALTVEHQSRSVRAAFASSYHSLDDREARLFRLLGLHPGTTFGIDLAAATAGWPVERTRQVLDDLAAACLIAEAVDGRYAFHDLVRLYAAERASADDPAGERAGAVARLLDWYLAVAEVANKTLTPAHDKVAPVLRHRPARLPFPASRTEVLAVLDAERANLPRVVRYAAEHGHPRQGWQLAYLTYGFFEHRGQGVEGIETCRWGLAAAERDPDGPVALMAMHAGMARLETGRPAEALAYLERALDLRAAAGNPREEAVTRINLGIAYRHLDRLDDALDSYRRAAALLSTAGDERAVSVCLLNLGCLHTARGEPTEGLAELRHALSIQRRIGDEQSAGYTLTSMGEAHLSAGDIAAAIDRLQDALALQQRIGDRHTAAASHDTLGRCHQALGDDRTALGHFRQALDIHRASGDHASATRTRADIDALSHHGR